MTGRATSTVVAHQQAGSPRRRVTVRANGSQCPEQALTRKLPRRRAHNTEANQEQVAGKTSKGRWGQTSQLQMVGCIGFENTKGSFCPHAEHLSISLRTCCRPGKIRGPNTNKYELQMQKQKKQVVCHSWHSEKQNAKNDDYLVLSSKEDYCEELCNCKIQNSVGQAKYESVARIPHLLTNCYGPPDNL